MTEFGKFLLRILLLSNSFCLFLLQRIYQRITSRSWMMCGNRSARTMTSPTRTTCPPRPRTTSLTIPHSRTPSTCTSRNLLCRANLCQVRFILLLKVNYQYSDTRREKRLLTFFALFVPKKGWSLVIGGSRGAPGARPLRNPILSS